MNTIGDVLSGNAQWCALEADCSEVLPMLPDGGVDHVIQDPPYEVEAHTLYRRVKAAGGEGGARWGGHDSREALLQPISFGPLTEDLRNLVAFQTARLANRWSITFCQIEAAMRWEEAITRRDDGDGGRQRTHARRRIGIWVKPDGQPQLSGDRPGMGFESIVFTHAKGRSRWNGGGRNSIFTCNKFIPSDGRNVHPTQKPLPLLMELVELFTDPGDLVLDPFCGSGGLGVACIRLGRRYIGIDNGKDANGKPWAQWAREGLEAEDRGLTRAAARVGQIGLFERAAT